MEYLIILLTTLLFGFLFYWYTKKDKKTPKVFRYIVTIICSLIIGAMGYVGCGLYHIVHTIPNQEYEKIEMVLDTTYNLEEYSYMTIGDDLLVFDNDNYTIYPLKYCQFNYQGFLSEDDDYVDNHINVYKIKATPVDGTDFFNRFIIVLNKNSIISYDKYYEILKKDSLTIVEPIQIYN